jgi:hypothetical protein
VYTRALESLEHQTALESGLHLEGNDMTNLEPSSYERDIDGKEMLNWGYICLCISCAPDPSHPICSRIPNGVLWIPDPSNRYITLVLAAVNSLFSTSKTPAPRR